MRNYEFVCWLEGYFDMCPDDVMDIKKARVLRNHLNLVKAVEGQLGELNTKLYAVISEGIDNGLDMHKTHYEVKSLLTDFLAREFPTKQTPAAQS